MEQELTYYEKNKESMKESNQLYKLNNKEKVKKTNKQYRQHYNKMNAYCKICNKIFLKTSKTRHNQRKHEQKPTLTWID